MKKSANILVCNDHYSYSLSLSLGWPALSKNIRRTLEMRRQQEASRWPIQGSSLSPTIVSCLSICLGLHKICYLDLGFAFSWGRRRGQKEPWEGLALISKFPVAPFSRPCFLLTTFLCLALYHPPSTKGNQEEGNCKMQEDEREV